MDCNLPGFSVHGILHARILGWVVISFTNTHTHNTHTHKGTWTKKQDEIILLAAIWVDLEIIILSKPKTNTIWYHWYMESETMIQWTYFQYTKRLTDTEKKNLWSPNGVFGERQIRSLGLIYAQQYILKIVNDLLYIPWNCNIYYNIYGVQLLMTP